MSRTGEEPDLHLQGRHKETQDGSRKISDAHQDDETGTSSVMPWSMEKWLPTYSVYSRNRVSDSLSSSSTLDSLMPVL